MNVFEFSLVLGAGAFVAGFLGSLTGLGGGVVIVPLLTLALGVDIRYAVGASLISVIATSSGAASAYVKEGFSNIRVGMFLEVATSTGALFGAFLAALVSTRMIGLVFGVVLLHAAYHSLRPHVEQPCGESPPQDRIATLLRMHGAYPTPQGLRPYYVRAVPLGFGLMFGAGTLSGLLGIGSGALKVIAMDQAMRLPFKVSSTTSNFMIGVTAAASAGVYLSRGYIDPGLAMPVVLGVLAGSFFGARFLASAGTRLLRNIFAGLVTVLAVEMIYNSLKGRI
ncbi:MAG: sulfite exporter TauE/SafE family protein [Bryobacterales bacterium]|nr:sulfite exporter TauE/SafE family protein [Bryobacterales bacterium]